jgi:hypothetical protein
MIQCQRSQKILISSLTLPKFQTKKIPFWSVPLVEAIRGPVITHSPIWPYVHRSLLRFGSTTSSSSQLNNLPDSADSTDQLKQNRLNNPKRRILYLKIHWFIKSINQTHFKPFMEILATTFTRGKIELSFNRPIRAMSMWSDCWTKTQMKSYLISSVNQHWSNGQLDPHWKR